MCGRYALGKIADDLIEEFDLDDAAHAFLRPPDFNIAPTTVAPVVRERADVDGVLGRHLDGLRWGLVPPWAADLKVGVRMINARSETLLEKPAFRSAAVRRRALVPADGWFEWTLEPTGKQPSFMTLADGSTCAFAAICELWRGPAGEVVETFAVITTAAEPALERVHDRMPVVLPAERWADWLDPAQADKHTVAGLMADLPLGRFAVRPVSTLVNSVRNRGPECIAPRDR